MLRLLSGVLLLVAAGASHAAQFRVTQSTLSVARLSPIAASWGNVAVFAGGLGGENVLDVFVGGTRVNTTTLVEDRPRAAASVYPGIAVFADSSQLEFVDMRTLTLWAPVASAALTSSAQENGGIGSETTSVAAFATLDGTVDLVNVSARQIIPSNLSTGRRSMGAARVRDSSGAEYFAFAAGTVILGQASAVVNVLPMDSLTAFVTAPSRLSRARSEAICTTTSANKIVCVGGNDLNGLAIPVADVCTIGTSGVLSCVATLLPSDANKNPYAIASLGPFVLAVTNVGLRYGLTVVDDGFTQEKTVATFPWTLWHSYTATSTGTAAYFAGGAIGIGAYTRNVTVIECLAPCQAPLIGPSATSSTVTSGASSLATTVGTTVPVRTAETAAGSVAKLSALAVVAAAVCGF
jgi:hypothetical protein